MNYIQSQGFSMNKFFFSVFGIITLTITSGNAAVYKGQKVYIEECRKCHPSGQEISYSRDKSQWKELMENKGDGLAKLHTSSKEAKKSWTYFESKQYSKRSRHLKDFMMEYAKDSGKVPACD